MAIELLPFGHLARLAPDTWGTTGRAPLSGRRRPLRRGGVERSGNRPAAGAARHLGDRDRPVSPEPAGRFHPIPDGGTGGRACGGRDAAANPSPRPAPGGVAVSAGGAEGGRRLAPVAFGPGIVRPFRIRVAGRELLRRQALPPRPRAVPPAEPAARAWRASGPVRWPAAARIRPCDVRRRGARLEGVALRSEHAARRRRCAAGGQRKESTT